MSADGAQWPGVTQRRVATNGIQLNVAEAGKGPLVLLLHGYDSASPAWGRMRARATPARHTDNSLVLALCVNSGGHSSMAWACVTVSMRAHDAIALSAR